MSALAHWTGRAAITGLGLVTPVGPTALSSLAAFRAGVTRLGDLPQYVVTNASGEPEPVTGAVVPDVPAARGGAARLARLAAPALREALESARVPPDAETAVFLGLARPPRAGRVLEDGPELEATVQDVWADRTAPLRVRLQTDGRAAGLRALRRAVGVVAERPDLIAIVGGVDSQIDPLTLRDLDRAGRLRAGARASGLLPGEAAGFLVVESLESAKNRGVSPLAEVRACAGAVEPAGPGEPTRALALASVLRAVRSAQTVPTPLVVSDLNGERGRAFEWMFAFTRGTIAHEVSPRHWNPAESTGDTGAADGALTTAWAARALARGWAWEREAIVWGASDEGAREAVLLAAPADSVRARGAGAGAPAHAADAGAGAPTDDAAQTPRLRRAG